MTNEEQTSAARVAELEAENAALRQAGEELARSWDGCRWEEGDDVGATIRHDFKMYAERALAAPLPPAAAPAVPGEKRYTDAIGAAGERYHAKFSGAHPLPATWRWSELWDAMLAAAAPAPESQPADDSPLYDLAADKDFAEDFERLASGITNAKTRKLVVKAVKLAITAHGNAERERGRDIGWMEAAPTAQPTPCTEYVTRESALAALDHVEQHNGPGRKAEAVAMLEAAQPTLPDDKLTDDEADPVRLWAEIHRLRWDAKGPDGFATWRDAAVEERKRRVKAEAALRHPPVPNVGELSRLKTVIAALEVQRDGWKMLAKEHAGATPNPDAQDAARDLYGEALEHAAFYVRDHCLDGEEHADIIANLKRPAGAAAGLPSTPEEIIAFIGSHCDAMEEAPNPEDVRYRLSVHDLQSAFVWWRIGFTESVAARAAAAKEAPCKD